ncbi:MAG: 4'-phosphopantetheinyl transferase superfamily protein, partial [Candidatus Hydrogenedentota bacterium]
MRILTNAAPNRGEVFALQARADDASFKDDDLRATLAPDELERAARFHFDRDRRMYMLARGLSRIILGHFLSIAPSAVCFEFLPHGKPVISASQNPYKLEFNYAHSNGLVLFAFSREARVGVDVESAAREVGDRDEIAARYFASGEVERYRALPDHQKPRAFLNCWTRKEAYIKAIGDGLSMPLSKFEAAFELDQPARLLTIHGNK